MVQLYRIEILLPELRAYAIAICQSRDSQDPWVQDRVRTSKRSPLLPGSRTADLDRRPTLSY